MTSISTSMSSAAMMSPNDRMKLQLQSAVSAGTIDASDQSALSSALDDIDTAIRSSGPPQAGTDPSSMKTNIDSLIDKEVSDGKLTDDQATELKKLFASSAPKGPGGPPPAGGTEDATATTATASTSDSSSSSDTTDDNQDLIAALTAFLQKFQESVSANSPYTADGSSSTSSRSSVFFDSNA